MSAEPPALPRPLDDDDDDVAWALQTAQVQWERGGAADAVVWLKRAAEAAAEAGEFGRSADIQRRANELDRWLKQPRPAFPLQPDDDDGVDDLLETDAPEIEAGGLRDMSPSLVDAIEAEARGDAAQAPVDEGAPVADLGDVEDVEDIEAVDLDDFEEERQLEGYQELLDETTHARSEVARALVTSPIPERLPARPLATRSPAPTRAPSSQRAPGSQRAPSSQKAPASDRVQSPPPSSRSTKFAERAPASQKPRSTTPQTRPRSPAAPRESRQPLETRRVPPPAEYKLPPPPIPRLPLPVPQPSTAPPPLELGEPRQPFPSEPATRPVSERPAPPEFLEPRERVESMLEVAASDIELPALDAPFSSSPPRARSVMPEAPVSSAAPAELDAAVDALSETPPPPPVLEVALLAACRGLEDLPPETQAELASKARIEVLAPDQEVSGFGLALVTQGQVVVMPTIAEGACGYASRGEPVFSRGTLAEGVPLRAVATADGAEVAVWRPEDFEQVLETCPWVADELRAVADRYQALAGAAMGPLGDRLDDHMRAMLTDRCHVRVLLAGEVLIEEGKPPSGLFIVGGGRLEVVSGGALLQELGPGDLPFASAVLTHEKATATVRASATGAVVLHADRMSTHELIVSVPPLLELLSTV